MKISLLVADDHPVIRQGVISLLKGSEIQVVAEAGTGNQAIDQAMKLQPDVVLLDVRMPDTDGLEALQRIVGRLSAQGCHERGVVSAIQRAHKGLPPETDSPMGKVWNTIARCRPTYDDDIPLTNREVQVVPHVALGLSNREIGRSLDISIETVKEHVQNVCGSWRPEIVPKQPFGP